MKKSILPSIFSKNRFWRSFSAFTLALFSIALIPNSASAQTLGDIMCSMYVNLGPFAPFLSTFSWVAGGILMGTGALKIKEHADSPQNHPLHHGIARMVGGSALLALPYTAQFIINTLALNAGPGGILVCIPGGIVGLPALDLVSMLENFVGNITVPLIDLVSVSAWIMGILFIMRGLMRAAKYGTDPRSSSVPHILGYLVTGGLLIMAGQTFMGVTNSLFGLGTSDIMDYATNVGRVMSWNAMFVLGASPAFGTAVSAGLTFIQLVGMLAFIRGIYIVKNSVEGNGQSTMAQGFTHIVGGALAINIYTFLEAVDSTLGTGLL